MLESTTDVATKLTATRIITDHIAADSPAITDSAPIMTVSTTDPAKIASEAAKTHHPSHPMITRSQSTEQEKASHYNWQSQGQDSHIMVNTISTWSCKTNSKVCLDIHSFSKCTQGTTKCSNSSGSYWLKNFNGRKICCPTTKLDMDPCSTHLGPTYNWL